MAGYANEPNRIRFPDLTKKAEDFFADSLYPVVINYPQAEKYNLCRDTKDAAAKMLHAITCANNKTSKRAAMGWLDTADEEKDRLLMWIKIAHRRKYITEKKKGQLQREIAAIGQLIGGAKRYMGEQISKGNTGS